MKKHLTSLGIVLISSAFVTGCATSNYAKEANITIERINSSSVKITSAYITKTSQGLKLRGEVKRKKHSHAPVPGHIHVEIVNPNGDVIKTIELDPSAKGSSDHIAWFHATLPQEAIGNKLTITHHDMVSHKQIHDVATWKEHEH